jgi:hypothetical protein
VESVANEGSLQAKQVTGIDLAIKRKLHESGKRFWPLGCWFVRSGRPKAYYR